MYDEIKCEFKLPDPEVQNHTFQTKAFGNLMDKYTITVDGKLIWHKCHWESVPEEERPYYGTEKWEEEKSIYRFIGSIKTVFDEDVFMKDYFGEVAMYTIHNNLFYEYKVQFIDGIIYRLIPVEKEELKNAVYQEREQARNGYGSTSDDGC